MDYGRGVADPVRLSTERSHVLGLATTKSDVPSGKAELQRRKTEQPEFVNSSGDTRLLDPSSPPKALMPLDRDTGYLTGLPAVGVQSEVRFTRSPGLSAAT